MRQSSWCSILPVCLAAISRAAGQTLSDSVADRLRHQLAAAPGPEQRFYERRGLRPAWSGEVGPALAASELRVVLSAADQDGLPPDRYTLPAAPHALDPDTLAAFDVALTRAALRYASDVATGQVDPRAVDSMWTAASHAIDVTALLAAAVAAWRIPTLDSTLRPPQAGYSKLRGALARYRALDAQGGWPALPAGAALAPGDSGARVRALRARLSVEGDLERDNGSEHYDSVLAGAVTHFQERHGLAPDGAIGPVTLAALNVSAAARVREIELNLERWRWLPRAPEARFVMVNTPAFELTLVDEGRVVLTMHTIVGRPDWPTPIVTGRITALVFAPIWDIPRAIALAEVVPAIRRDSTYLGHEHIRVFPDSTGAPELDSRSVDWSQVSDTTFAWRLRQDPGGTNPLGGLKFALATPFDVCLHDTPQRAPFRERRRALSHGCVRLEHAPQLAGYLLEDPVRWPADSIRAAMAGPAERWVGLGRPLPVYLCYWTAWVDETGSVQFRDDLYAWDARLAAALAARR